MRPVNLAILLVEDNPGDRRLVREALGEIPELRFELIEGETLANGLDRLAAYTFDVGLVDLGLPDARGVEVVRRVHEAAPNMPLLVLTALDDEAVAIQALQEGAQDYLVKARVDSAALWRALRYAMERHQLQLGLLNLSLVDDLTGVSNRKGFLSLANHHARLAQRTGKRFLVGFVDVDGLKHINDTFGHQEGNHALVETAGVLKDSFRQSDILARYGGDEFAVLVSDADEASTATVISRVQDKVRIRNEQPGRVYQLALSIGIVSSNPASPADLEALLHHADRLMYEQKIARRRRTGPDRTLAGQSR